MEDIFEELKKFKLLVIIMSKTKTETNVNYQDYFDKDLSLRDPDLYASIKQNFKDNRSI